MHRVMGLLIFTAMGLGFYLFLADVPPAGAPQALKGTPFAYGGWGVGLLMGLALAWFAALDWNTLPQRIAAWVRLQRHRLAWMLVGGVCTGILLLL